MRALFAFWILLLLALAVPAVAQEDDLFGDAPATDKATEQAAPAGDVPMAEEAGTEDDGDLFGDSDAKEPAAAPAKAPTNDPLPEDAIQSTPLVPARKLHTRAEIKAELNRRNATIAAEVTRFIERNKQAARKAVNASKEQEAALMPILSEYGPAVIRTRQLWTHVVGNPAQYDTWLGSADYWRAWVAFHNSWRSLYGYTDRFAAVDPDLANTLNGALTTLGTSFEDYSKWVDEWDRELGNDNYAFVRGNNKLGQLNQQQMRAEEGDDAETAEAFRLQTLEEEGDTAPADVEEADQATEEADRKELTEGEKEADAAADRAVESSEPEDASADGEDDLFGGAAADETPAEEAAPADKKAPKDAEEDEAADLFGEG